MTSFDASGPELIPPRAEGAPPFQESDYDLRAPLFGLASALQAHEALLANHQGQLSGFWAAIAAVQSSLASWKAAAIGVSGAIFAVIALLGALQFTTMQSVDSVDAKVTNLSERFADLEVEVKSLPAALSQKLTELAAGLATIGQRGPIVIQQQPPAPSREEAPSSP